MSLTAENTLEHVVRPFVAPSDVGLADLRDASARENLVQVVQHLFFTSLRANQCPDRDGFYLTMHYQACGGWVSEQRKIGTVPPDKEDKYRNFSREKCIRLSGYPDHVCSMQSRNPELDRYGGAIKVRGGFVGISGLPETYDEIGSTSASLCVGLISFEDAEAIMDASKKAQSSTGKEVYPVAQGLVLGLLDTVYGS
jgi:hypothetical protein